ncbi:MAG: cytidine deaminase [Nocardioides sp.]
MDNPLTEEDAKLVVLARGTRARAGGAREGAALRDSDGRTYAGATVDLASLGISAVQVCVAMAVSSGARGVEAAVVLGAESEPRAADLAALADLSESNGPPDDAGSGVVLHVADPTGTIVTSIVVPPSTGRADETESESVGG